MTVTMEQIGQDPAFERFLRATVGEDENGIHVSVLSMLARLEVDPWTEASDLAAMPDGPARKRLDTLMTRFTDVPTVERDQGKIISILLDLLPRKSGTANPNAPDMKNGLPTLVIGIPLYWYIVAILVLGVTINLA